MGSLALGGRPAPTVIDFGQPCPPINQRGSCSRPWSRARGGTRLAAPSARNRPRRGRMNTITTKDGTQIYYKDWGRGEPVVFSHGWPLSADAWEDQMLYLAARGYRCIAHDRRGHGR